MTLTTKQHIVFLCILASLILFLSRDASSPAVTSYMVTHVEAEERSPASVPITSQGKYEYLEITQSCGPDFEGHCIPAYSGPGTEYIRLDDLRNGMILKVKSIKKVNGVTWYRVYFDEWLRYPERVSGDWYVPAVAGHIVASDGEQILKSKATTSKKIIVDLSDHMIYAYDGNTLFLTTKNATGLDSTPTPTGTFTIFKKTPSRYMQGPLPGINDNPFDLPGVPWNMYFTQGGAVIHGSYWHDRYGTEQSSGCINLPPEIAKILYDWAPLGTTVTIQD